MKKIISIAMTTFNGEKYLRQQLSSIASQTMLPDELIVCDDGSSDATLSILSEFKLNAPFEVKIMKNKNRLGSVKNFEFAINSCDGDIIYLSDQDDIWLNNRIERSSFLFKSNPRIGYVFSNATCIDEFDNIIRGSLWERVRFSRARQLAFGNSKTQISELFLGNFVTGATLAFRSDLRNLISPFPILRNIQHDYWIAMVLSAMGCFGLAINDPLIHYRIHPRQQCGIKQTRFGTIKKQFERINSAKKGIEREIEFISLISSSSGCTNRELDINLVQHYINLKKRGDILSETKLLHRFFKLIYFYYNGGYATQKTPIMSAIKDLIVS